jgi:hypothetical protein
MKENPIFNIPAFLIGRLQECVDDFLDYAAGFLDEDDGAVAGPKALHELLRKQLCDHGMAHETELCIGEYNGKIEALVEVARGLFPEHGEVLLAVENAEQYIWDGG